MIVLVINFTVDLEYKKIINSSNNIINFRV